MASVLLYSTGLDSELYRLLEKPDKLLFFQSGARYEKFETKQLHKFQKMGLLDNHEIIVDDTLNFHKLERADSIVPMRNIFYILRALEYAQNVYLGITYYDLHYDKQPDVLGALISFVQSYYYFRDTPETWDEGPRPNIIVPYRGYTKGELLKLAIDSGEDVSHIPTLRTCYDGHSEKGCGKCKSCVAKAIALAVNGMFKPEYFDEDPRKVGKSWIDFYEHEADGNIDVDVFRSEVETLLGTIV